MGEEFRNRQLNILTVILVAGLILIGRAFQLQIWDSTFTTQADAVAISKKTIYPSRGLIFDRNGKLLINNAAVYDLMVIYNQLRPGMDTAKFCSLLGIDKNSFRERLDKDFKRDKRFSKLKPFVFMDKITPEMYAAFSEHLYQFPGFFAQVRNVRSYPVRNAAHVLGYITEVTDRDIADSLTRYVMGDYIGASGLEAAHETELMGVKGARHVLKDNLGRDVGSFQNGKLDTAAQSGMDIISSLDIEVQAYAELLMQNKIGAVVAIEPKTGEILAFLSSPTYDPNMMVIDQDRGQSYMTLQNDPSKPLFNRAIMAQYPPGSTYKTLVGLVGMQIGAITAETGMSCPGYFVNGGGDVRKCRGHASPGNISIALQHSCNSYFFRTFREIVDHYGYYSPGIGLDTFAYYMGTFGLGRKLGVDFPGEKTGNVPNSKYFNKIYPKDKGGWRSPTIVSIGIGQGEIQLTTIQMANAAALIANRGYYYIPHFVRNFRQDGKDLPKPKEFLKRNRVPVSAYHFQWVADGMLRVVEAGTARSAQIPGVSVAGKTGTVQNPHGEDHSTFIGFAPMDNPKIAIAVYVENSGGGGKYAAPIASLIMEKYIQREIHESRKHREKQILETNLLQPKPKVVLASVNDDPDVAIEPSSPAAPAVQDTIQQ